MHKIIPLILVIALVFGTTGCRSNRFFDDNTKASDIAYSIVSWSSASSPVCNLGTINFMNEAIDTRHAQAAALYNITDNQLLYSKNINEKLFPASTTKILTAYVALKYGDLKSTLTISSRCVKLEPGATRCGFKVGDKISLEQALYGLMTCSGNDAAVAIAEGVSGSVEAFADLMNKEATDMGATHSHFCNPHGLHENEHYTTLDDLQIIFREAVKNNKFRDLISHTEYTGSVVDANGETHELTWGTTNAYFRDSSLLPEKVTILGAKTGYTDQAGACLVLLSKGHNNKEYISIILKSQNSGMIYPSMNSMFDKLIKN